MSLKIARDLQPTPWHFWDTPPGPAIGDNTIAGTKALTRARAPRSEIVDTQRARTREVNEGVERGRANEDVNEGGERERRRRGCRSGARRLTPRPPPAYPGGQVITHPPSRCRWKAVCPASQLVLNTVRDRPAETRWSCAIATARRTTPTIPSSSAATARRYPGGQAIARPPSRCR
jgi:hypothetical protein